MTVVIQKEIPAILIITVLLCVLCVVAGKKIKAADPYEKPKGLVFGALYLIEWIDGMVREVMGERSVKSMGPYIGTLTLYLAVANLSGLFGFNTPTMNLSVTIALAFITWVLIQRASIKSAGIGGYLHGLIEPFPFMVAGNIISKFTPLISMSMRLYGNILSGSILMSLVYTATNIVSNLLIGKLVKFNIVGVVLAPVLHAYFDVFSGLIQMYIFISLTMALVANELGEE